MVESIFPQVGLQRFWNPVYYPRLPSGVRDSVWGAIALGEYDSVFVRRVAPRVSLAWLNRQSGGFVIRRLWVRFPPLALSAVGLASNGGYRRCEGGSRWLVTAVGVGARVRVSARVRGARVRGGVS